MSPPSLQIAAHGCSCIGVTPQVAGASTRRDMINPSCGRPVCGRGIGYPICGRDISLCVAVASTPYVAGTSTTYVAEASALHVAVALTLCGSGINPYVPGASTRYVTEAASSYVAWACDSATQAYRVDAACPMPMKSDYVSNNVCDSLGSNAYVITFS